jgi:hypothetical protein
MADILPGYDLFETLPGDTSFVFPNSFTLPADFFDRGSLPFAGTIPLEGVPVKRFTDPRNGNSYNTGTTDTIVFRKQPVTLNPSGTTEIEMVKLSLRSHSPIHVRVGHTVQHWDVFISVSTSKPSGGTMTITHAGNQRTFDSQLRPTPLFLFVRRSDGEERHLDVGAMKLPPEQQEHLSRAMTLHSSQVPWSPTPPEGDDTLIIPDLTDGFFAGCPIPVFELAAFARHGVKCPKKK